MFLQLEWVVTAEVCLATSITCSLRSTGNALSITGIRNTSPGPLTPMRSPE